MALIDLQNISKQYDTKVILKDVNFTLNHGQRIAVIGQNGQGKSTLFKVIMKQTEPDSGEMAIDKSLKIEMLDQQPKFKANLSVREAIENQLAELKQAKTEYEELTNRLTTDYENEELLSALENPTITKKEKENVVEKLFSDDIKSFLKVVCDNDDIACFDEAVEYYDELKRKTDKIIKAEFDYVTMPKDEQLERIKQYLMKQYQADEVDLTLKEDKDLIGGFMLKVGDHVYDNSLSGKMRKLQQKLTWR